MQSQENDRLRSSSRASQHHENDAIAGQLSFSPKTVRNYVANIFSKLQVADRAEAIVKAREAGLKQQLGDGPVIAAVRKTRCPYVESIGCG